MDSKNKEAIKAIAKKYGLKEERVWSTVSTFFSILGIKRDIINQRTLKIRGFGQFKRNRKGTLLRRRRAVTIKRVHNKELKKYMRKKSFRIRNNQS